MSTQGQGDVVARLEARERTYLDRGGLHYYMLEDAAIDAEAREEITRLRTLLSSSRGEQGWREALEWYAEQARLARLIHSEGDAGRHALADDGGKRARAVLDAPGSVPTSLAGQVPDDWTLVPNIGAYVEADHPITCLNPTKAFEVRHVECRSGSWYVRGENTCWFNVKGVKPATQENAVAAEEAAALQSSPQPTAAAGQVPEGFADQVWGLSMLAQAELDNGDTADAQKTLVRIAEVASAAKLPQLDKHTALALAENIKRRAEEL